MRIPTQQNNPDTQETEPQSIVTLQLIVNVLMTKFIRDHNPKISHLLVRQLYLLIDHPDVNRFPECKECYLQLQKQWQRTAEILLEQRKTEHPHPTPGIDIFYNGENYG